MARIHAKDMGMAIDIACGAILGVVDGKLTAISMCLGMAIGVFFGIFFSKNSNLLGRTIIYCKPFNVGINSADAGLNETTLGVPGTTSPYDDDRITVALHEHGHFLRLGHSNYYSVMRNPYAVLF